MNSSLLFFFTLLPLFLCNISVYYVPRWEVACNETISYHAENQTIWVIGQLSIKAAPQETQYRRCINHFIGVFLIFNGTGLTNNADDTTHDYITFNIINSTIYGDVTYFNDENDFTEFVVNGSMLYSGTWEMHDVNLIKMKSTNLRNISVIVPNFSFALFSEMKFQKSILIFYNRPSSLMFSMFTAENNTFDFSSIIHIRCITMDISITHAIAHYFISDTDRKDCNVLLSN